MLPDGRVVDGVTLTGGQTCVTVISYGAAIQALRTPDRDGQVADIVIGHDDLSGYLAGTHYFGSTVGRYANRIAGAQFALDGQTYRLSANQSGVTLHGGEDGFDRRLWDIVAIDNASVSMRLVSPNGDQGFPGRLTATVHYAIDGDGALSITFRAATDRSTIVNMTNHAYWNLSGDAARNALGAVLTIPADHYLPVDAALIPTGEFRAVAGTPFDFRRAMEIGARIDTAGGYDHNWVIGRAHSPEPRLVATLSDPHSGRVLDVLSTEPGLQFYSGNFLDGITGKGRRRYTRGDAVCLEPQRFPDTPNRIAFGSAQLDPGQAYTHRIVYRFSTVSQP